MGEFKIYKAPPFIVEKFPLNRELTINIFPEARIHPPSTSELFSSKKQPSITIESEEEEEEELNTEEPTKLPWPIGSDLLALKEFWQSNAWPFETAMQLPILP